MEDQKSTHETPQQVTPPSAEELMRLREETADRVSEGFGGIAASEYMQRATGSEQDGEQEPRPAQEAQETGGLGITQADKTEVSEQVPPEEDEGWVSLPEDVAPLHGSYQPLQAERPSVGDQASEGGVIGVSPENDHE